MLASKYAPNHNVNPKKNRFVIKEIVTGMIGGILHHVVYHYSKATLLGMPDWHTEIEDLIAKGDKVAARITMIGTHIGDFFGFQQPAKNKLFRHLYCADCEWKDRRALG